MHKAIEALIIPLPNTKATTTESKITGIEKIVSIKSDKHLSKIPPKYPLNNPKGNPIIKAKDNARNTTSIAIDEPCKVLKQTSLPNLSVPHRCCNEGGANISLLNDVKELPKKLLASNTLIIITIKKYESTIKNPVLLMFLET
tara:strand:- start:315 stop:743 length:429 start_codon:yes stop_codon:yes gene_type:complete